MTIDTKRLNRARLLNHLQTASAELSLAFCEIGSSPARHDERCRLDLAMHHVNGLLSLLDDETEENDR